MKSKRREPAEWNLPESHARLDVMADARAPELVAALEKATAGRPLDLLVTNSVFRKLAGIGDGRYMEFGFPSFFSHALYDSPHLGFNGCMCFIDRVAERLCFYEG